LGDSIQSPFPNGEQNFVIDTSSKLLLFGNALNKHSQLLNTFDNETKFEYVLALT
jgi:hypothetical protein